MSIIVSSFQQPSTLTSPGTANLEAWYNFDGDLLDAHTNNYDLTNSGATFSNNELVMNAGDDYVRHTFWTPVALPLSCACWLTQKDSDAGVIASVWEGYSNNKSWMWVITSSGTIELFDSQNGSAVGAPLETELGLQSDIRTHIAFSYSPSSFIRIYINGKLKAEKTTSVPSSLFNNQVAKFAIGRTWGEDLGTGLKGAVDDFSLWSKALTMPEVKWLAAGNGYSDL